MLLDRKKLSRSSALWTIAATLLLARFLWLNETVYILDEPYFQLKLDEIFAAGTFPLTSFRGSSIPIPYGAGGLWFYALIRLFTWHPVPIALYHLVYQTAGALLFLWTIRKAYGAEAGAWCAWLVASSPLLFFLSRHAWDNTLLIPLGALVLYLLQRSREDNERQALWHHLALGMVVGYGLNIHLMFGPVALALGITLAVRAGSQYGLRSRRFWLPLLAFGLTALVLVLPYLWEALRLAQEEKAMEHAKIKERWGDGRNLWWLFQRTTLFSSIYQARIYLDDVRSTFYPYVGRTLAFFIHNDLFGWFGKLAAWLSAGAVLLGLARGRLATDPIRLFAALAFVCTLVIYQYLNIPTAPHYFNPLWWFVFVGIAWAITKLGGWPKRLFLLSLLGSGLVNTAFDVSALAFVHENKGARNMQTSVVVYEQLRAIRELCLATRAAGREESRVDLRGTMLVSPAFLFLPKHLEECSGVRLTAASSIPNPHFRLHHPADSTTKMDILIEVVTQ